MYVMPELPQAFDMIIGMDWMIEYDAWIHPASGRVSTVKNGKQHMLSLINFECGSVMASILRTKRDKSNKKVSFADEMKDVSTDPANWHRDNEDFPMLPSDFTPDGSDGRDMDETITEDGSENMDVDVTNTNDGSRNVDPDPASRWKFVF